MTFSQDFHDYGYKVFDRCFHDPDVDVTEFAKGFKECIQEDTENLSKYVEMFMTLARNTFGVALWHLMKNDDFSDPETEKKLDRYKGAISKLEEVADFFMDYESWKDKY